MTPPKARTAAPRPSPASFLPTTREEALARGWDAIDVLLVSGDAYVDHPSFGTAVIGRVLEARGYRVGVIAQPDWRSPGDIARMGRPRLFAGVTSGAMDSMVNHYTAHKRRRSDDAYTPGGVAGRRPDRATPVYGQGEKPVLEIARRLASGEDICGLVDVPGTALAVKDLALAALDGRSRKVLELPAYEEIAVDRRRFAEFSRLYHLEHDVDNARI